MLLKSYSGLTAHWHAEFSAVSPYKLGRLLSKPVKAYHRVKFVYDLRTAVGQPADGLFARTILYTESQFKVKYPGMEAWVGLYVPGGSLGESHLKFLGPVGGGW